MDQGYVLIALVGVLAIVALVLVRASTPDGDRKRRDLVKESHKLIDSAAKASGQQPMLLRTRRAEEDAPPIFLSALIVPPPDEARIEAVAPKNEPSRRAV